MTDPVVRSHNAAHQTDPGTSLPANMPAGFVSGDLLLAEYVQRGSTAAADTPAGWTPLYHGSGSGRSVDVFGKVAAGGETLTIGKPSTDPASVFTQAIQIGTYDTTQWVESFTSLMAQGSSSTPPLPEATASAAGATAISVGGIRNNAATGTGLTKPGTWTDRGSGYCDDNTNGMAVGCCSKTIATAGTTGAANWSSPVSNSGPLLTFVVRPSGGTAPTKINLKVWDHTLNAGAGGYRDVVMRDWRSASSDYLPLSSPGDPFKAWSSASGQYQPGGANPDTVPPTPPGAITADAITQTTITFSWGASTDNVGVTGYRIRINGGSWVDEPTTSHQFTGLTASTAYTPEVQARDAAGNWSTTTTGSAATTSAAPDVTPPTQPGQPSATPTGGSVALAWTASTDAVGVTAYDVHRSATSGFTPTPATLRLTVATNSATEDGVPTGTWYYRIIARDAAGNASTASTQRSVAVTAPSSPMLMGCSASDEDHGGTEIWDGWRCYNRSKAYTLANRTGTQRPQFLAYSEDGPNLQGTYTQVYNHCIQELDTFYYGNAAGTLGSGTGSNTHSIRWGIQLFWSNGNENHDKGDLSGTHTPAKIAAYTETQRGLYDAVHYAPGGVRRYPDAYAGSNPTHNAEFSGLVADWLHPSAQYHDFVMWSMYPPGRKQTQTDPTYNWPSFVEADRTKNPGGFMIRCYYRTREAQAQARVDTGDPTFSLMIGCGEVANGSDPDDETTRPYYAALGLAGAMYILADQYGLTMPFACWWDNFVSDGHSILSDEGSVSDHANGTQPNPNPTTRQAWQNWFNYDPRRGGTKPASWAGNPKASWQQTGTPV